jgi:hypothetical protein
MKRSLRSNWGIASLLALALALSMTIWACSGDNETLTSPQEKPVGTLSYSDPGMMGAIKVQDRHSSALFAVEGVVGHMVSVDDSGAPFMVVMTERELPKGSVPTEIEGIRVEQRVTGRFKAYKGPGGGGGKKPKPIKLGVSGGWRYDLANGYCCGGTLGSLVTDGAIQYILSNYHVFYGDSTPGGNGIVATAGDPVINPGLIDVQCDANRATDVANLAGSRSLPGSNVDAAIAAVIENKVDPTGAIDKIGTVSTTTIPWASLVVGQEVKKMGRTSGLTRSTFAGIGSAQVDYENECAGGYAFTNVFTDQVFVNQGVPGFLQGGDSGSLLVEDVRKNPRPIGLLYAGSAVYVVANPIDDVLAFFGVSMVGK